MMAQHLLTDEDLKGMPDPHADPNAFLGWLQHSSASSMTAVEQMTQMDKDRTFGETVRSHQADEGHAAAQLGETTRHNKVDERSQQTDQALRRQQIAGEGWQVMVDPANGNQPYRINARTGAAVTLDGQPYQPKGVMKVGSNTARSGTAMAVQKFLEENPNATAEDVAKFNSHLRAQAAGQTAFNSGPLGSKVRSLNVAVDHLETLQGVANALGNGDAQALNRLKQNFQQQFGSAIPTNFDATKQLVAGEVANVVAAGGSTMHDRQEAEAIINRAGSPQQLTGAIKQVKRLMAGQVKGLRLQYQSSTGMDDFETHLLPATRSELESLDNGGTAAPAQGGRPPLASFGR
jgi:hypothetical protein